MRKPRILFVYNTMASWALRDLELLSSRYDVQPCFLGSGENRQSVSSTLGHVFQCDVLFCWFASLKFAPVILLAKLLGKKIVIISGGFDVACEPAIDYGAYTQAWPLRWLRTWLFKSAHKVLAVSEFNVGQAQQNAHVPLSKLQLVYHGFSAYPEKDIIPFAQRKNEVVMVGNVDAHSFLLKGMDQLIELATSMPDVKFHHVGRLTSDQAIPANLICHGYLQYNDDHFKRVISSSKVILQLSRCESFGAAVVDGTLMGCYPIVYNSGALSEVASGVGEVFAFGDQEKVAVAIRAVFTAPIDSASLSSKMLARFPLAQRTKAIHAVIDSIA